MSTKLTPSRREDPGGPDDEHLGAAREGAALATELAAAVGVDRSDRVVLAPGPARAAVENVVGRDVDEERAGVAAETREDADGDVVDGEVRRVGLGEVDAGVGGGVPDDAHARDDGSREGRGVGDVEVTDAEREGVGPLAREAPREHSARAEDQLRHAVFHLFQSPLRPGRLARFAGHGSVRDAPGEIEEAADVLQVEPDPEVPRGDRAEAQVPVLAEDLEAGRFPGQEAPPLEHPALADVVVRLDVEPQVASAGSRSRPRSSAGSKGCTEPTGRLS